jgi:hypothetical protein
MTIIDRLLRACATGVGCRALINLKTLRTISGLPLPVAMLYAMFGSGGMDVLNELAIFAPI